MQIPPLKGFGPTEAIKQVSQWLNNPVLNHAIKEAAQKLGVKEFPSATNVQEILKQAGKWLERAADPWLSPSDPTNHRSLELGINATGDLFHPRWVSPAVSEKGARLAAYLRSGYSQDIGISGELHRLILSATGASDALVVAGLPLAVLAVVKGMTSSSKDSSYSVILPRIACIRIPVHGDPSGVHLRNLIDFAGASVLEIGSNSDCSEEDYARALSSNPSSLVFQATPIHTENAQGAAMESAKSSGSIVCELALDGSPVDIDWDGSQTPALTRRWEAGADLMIVPTQFLFGGPESVLILGKKEPIDRVRTIVEQIGATADRVEQAILHSVLQQILGPDGWEKTRVGATLTTTLANLENRAQRLSAQLQGLPSIEKVEWIKQTVRIGTGPWQSLKLPSATLQVFPKGISPSRLNESLASHQPAIWSNVYSDRVELVLRTVEPSEDSEIARAFSSIQPV